MEPKYFPFDGNAYTPKVGVQALDVSQWIEIDPERWDRELDLRERILAKVPDLVVRALPEADDACFELREMVAAHLLALAPDRYRRDGTRLVVRGRAFDAPASPIEALRQLAQWTQEDWALLLGDVPRIVAGAVLFPSRWNLPDKLGLAPLEVHKPVPRFDTIAQPTERILGRLREGFPLWRTNWTIHDSDELHVPFPHPSDRGLTEANVLEKTFVRVERQTLRRLPRSGAVAFSIRTYVYRIADVVKDADRHRKLLGTLEGLPRESANYKGMRDFYDMLVAALRHRAPPESPAR
jgi:hypothetical protein